MNSWASFRKLSHKIENISNVYFLNKKMIKEQSNHNNGLNNSLLVPFYEYIASVENAFNCLDNVERMFINNDFFYQDYPFWWETIYSRCTYYRYKRKAMISFLKAYAQQ